MNFFRTLIKPFFKGWLYRRRIDIDNQGSRENKKNCQIKIILNSANFSFSKAKSDGSDLRIVDQNEFSVLNYWIESYNNASQNAVIWVKLDVINTASISHIFIYYGNSTAISLSSWNNTMQRIEKSKTGGDTKYLLKLDEGSGTIASNYGSLSGNITVQNSWATLNNYGYAGSALQFNGVSNNLSLGGLLDNYPISGEISISFILTAINGNDTVFFKNNVLSQGYISLFIEPITFKLCFKSYNGTLETNLKTNFSTAINILYKVSVVWDNGMIGLYVNGILVNRDLFYKNNGFESDFKIGCGVNNTTGVLNNFFQGKINDFRFTSYTNNSVINLQHIEAEHANIRLIEKDKRSKMSQKYLVNTNIPSGNIGLIKGETAGFYENNLYKLYHRKVGAILYRESTTALGILNANDITIIGGGLGGEIGNPACLSFLKENGIYYIFYCYDTHDSDLFVVSSPNGINFGNKKIALSKTTTGFGSLGLVNSSVIKKGNTFYMLIESRENVGWSIGLATSSVPDGPYAFTGNNPITALRQSPSGGYGGPDIWFENESYHFVYHANPVNNGKVYDQTYYGKTNDFINFTVDLNPILAIDDDIMAYDQTSDPSIFSDGIKTYIDFTCADNRNPFFVTSKRTEFNGTFDMFIKDLTITIGAEQAL